MSCWNSIRRSSRIASACPELHRRRFLRCSDLIWWQRYHNPLPLAICLKSLSQKRKTKIPKKKTNINKYKTKRKEKTKNNKTQTTNTTKNKKKYQKRQIQKNKTQTWAWDKLVLKEYCWFCCESTLEETEYPTSGNGTEWTMPPWGVSSSIPPGESPIEPPDELDEELEFPKHAEKGKSKISIFRYYYCYFCVPLEGGMMTTSGDLEGKLTCWLGDGLTGFTRRIFGKRRTRPLLLSATQRQLYLAS